MVKHLVEYKARSSNPSTKIKKNFRHITPTYWDHILIDMCSSTISCCTNIPIKFCRFRIFYKLFVFALDSVVANFMCYLNWKVRWPDIILDISMNIFLDEIDIYFDSTADYPR
jgi:hypothetical protein